MYKQSQKINILFLVLLFLLFLFLHFQLVDQFVNVGLVVACHSLLYFCGLREVLLFVVLLILFGCQHGVLEEYLAGWVHSQVDDKLLFSGFIHQQFHLHLILNQRRAVVMFLGFCHLLHQIFLQCLHFPAHYVIPFLLGVQGPGDRIENFLTDDGCDIAVDFDEVEFPGERVYFDLFFNPESQIPIFFFYKLVERLLLGIRQNPFKQVQKFLKTAHLQGFGEYFFLLTQSSLVDSGRPHTFGICNCCIGCKFTQENGCLIYRRSDEEWSFAACDPPRFRLETQELLFAKDCVHYLINLLICLFDNNIKKRCLLCISHQLTISLLNFCLNRWYDIDIDKYTT